MARSPSFAGLVLAAGKSSRMGRDKALLPWHGQTFLGAAIDTLNQLSELVIIVAGENLVSLQPIAYSKSAYLVENPDPERGQFSSLQIGLQAILDRGRDAAIITLVDRPPAASGTFAHVRRKFEMECGEKTWAVVPEYQGSHGHPIVIGREMMECFLRAPASSATARDVEHAYRDKILYVSVEDPFVTMNINTPEELEALNQGVNV